MSVYMIGLIQIEDRTEYEVYRQGFSQVFEKYAGEPLVVDEEPTVLEGSWPCTRTVVIRFPDEQEARRWYESDEYRTLAQHRFKAAKTNLILAKGRA